MRIPRTILLGLSPLLSLWALGAQLGAELPGNRSRTQATEQQIATDTLQRFIEPMVSFLLLAAEHDGSIAVTRPHAAQNVLALEALQFTTLHRSVWLVRQEPAVDLHARKHQTTLLRC
jgi:hypothetical protein